MLERDIKELEEWADELEPVAEQMLLLLAINDARDIDAETARADKAEAERDDLKTELSEYSKELAEHSRELFKLQNELVALCERIKKAGL